MKITPIKTSAITAGTQTLVALVDEYLPKIPDHSVVAISSKVVSICEGRLVNQSTTNREELVLREADYYRAPNPVSPHYHLTIKSGLLVGSAGIDQSNGNGNYVLWPEDPQATANAIRRHLAGRSGHSHIGVIITDSRSTPLRRGAIGLSLAHSGFSALRSYAGQPDVFGQYLKHEVANVVDALAATAVLAMGEGAQSTPLALIEDADFVEFQAADPTPAEIAGLKVPLTEDYFTEMLQAIPWDKRPS